METRFGLFLVFINFFKCNGDEILEQLDQISLGNDQGLDNNDDLPQYSGYRRYEDAILGIPSRPADLPPSEAILPGHTLIRPSFGMLKSALKFPHREYENGAGVDGNIKNLGLRYGATNQRLQYSSFRRMPADYVVVEVPNQPLQSKPHNLKLFYYGNKNTGTLPQDPKLRVEQADKEDYSIYMKPSSELLHVKDNKRHRGYKEIFASLDDVIAKLLKLRQEMEFASNPNTRRGRLQKYNLGADAGEFSSFDASEVEDKNEKHQRPQILEEAPTEAPSPKLSWWRTKKLFNHVKVQSDAPEFHDFLPKDAFKVNEKQWWYYVQDDFTSLTNTGD